MSPKASRSLFDHAHSILAEAQHGALSYEDRLDSAAQLARTLWRWATEHAQADERDQQRRLARLMADPRGQAFTTLLTDRAFRADNPRRLASTVAWLVRQLGPPTYLSAVERLQLRLASQLYPAFCGTVARAVRRRIRRESGRVLVSERDLSSYLQARRTQGVRVNVNHLGEEVLGAAQADRRLSSYETLLRRPDIDAISVKASSICERVDALAFDDTLQRLKPRLSHLYRLALAHPYPPPRGPARPKLVNLDMESYDDQEVTWALFHETLEQPEFHGLTAGIVLQAYLPDAFLRQQALTLWAKRRLEQGGAPIRLRIVKGANLALERALSSSRGWALPTYETKAEVDANYIRMVDYACQPEHARAVHVGIASHNVFDLAYGLVQRAAHSVEEYVGLELLEGMAEPLRRAVMRLCDDVLVYAPLVEDDGFERAMAYLVRRLDENTGPDNFLRHSFGMTVDDPAFEQERQRFALACRARKEIAQSHPHRRPVHGAAAAFDDLAAFRNEPDTDYTLAEERARALSTLARCMDASAPTLPLEIGGQETAGWKTVSGFDPSRPDAVPYRFALADADHVDAQIEVAVKAHAAWSARGPAERGALLQAVAQALREVRHELNALMAIDGGKRLEQADREVSEAIDFAEYYRLSYLALADHSTIALLAGGLTLVAPPWNFPLAITAGGVLAALMAGNAVILKPPMETMWVGRRFAELCWAAGIPRDALQLCPVTDARGSSLIRDPRVAQVVLTGATATARLFHRIRPGLRLMGETGGKNAIIAAAQCDRDRLIADVLESAFSHSGQKCSAASLLVCEAELYDDPRFLQDLADAVASLPVGSALDPRNMITPLIRAPSGPLAQGLTELGDGVEWLLKPRFDSDNPRLVSPGIKIGVQPGTLDHQTEFFGPLLSVMRAESLDQAIEFVNGTPYGLTSGLHSLDEREQARWLQRIRAGNLYINRGITGAIVQRQAFGGFKASSVGPGAKAGGPNYVLQLCVPKQLGQPVAERPPVPAVSGLLAQVKAHLAEHEHARVVNAACSYAQAQAEVFGQASDSSRVYGERNELRYVPIERLVIRLEGDFAPDDVLMACAAALTAGAGFVVSCSPAEDGVPPFLLACAAVTVVQEDPGVLAERVAALDRIRLLGPVPPLLLHAATAAGVHLEHSPVLSIGRFELLHYLREQSLSVRVHRYGNLAGAQLSPPAT